MFQRHRDDDPSETCPAADFLLNDCPDSVVQDLIAVIDAVADSPPPQFTGGGMWEAMHGEMTGYFEARIRGGGWLYRLFCLLEREAPGLDGPSIIVLTGLRKRVREAFSAADYGRVRALGEEYRRRSPRSVV